MDDRDRLKRAIVDLESKLAGARVETRAAHRERDEARDESRKLQQDLCSERDATDDDCTECLGSESAKDSENVTLWAELWKRREWIAEHGSCERLGNFDNHDGCTVCECRRLVKGREAGEKAGTETGSSPSKADRPEVEK